MARKTETGFLNRGITDRSGADYVVVELRHDSAVGIAPTGLVAAPEAEEAKSGLDSILNRFNCRKLKSHFDKSKTALKKRIKAAPASLDVEVSADFAQSGFMQVFPRRKRDAHDLADELNKAAPVWKAVVAPRPVPAAAATGPSAASRNFEPAQGYLCDAPNGIGAIAGWDGFDAKGKGVTICDIEGNWHFDHEDLPAFRLIGGTPINNLGWRNHGTAVLGEMVAKPGGI